MNSKSTRKRRDFIKIGLGVTAAISFPGRLILTKEETFANSPTAFPGLEQSKIKKILETYGGEIGGYGISKGRC